MSEEEDKADALVLKSAELESGRGGLLPTFVAFDTKSDDISREPEPELHLDVDIVDAVVSFICDQRNQYLIFRNRIN